MNEPDPLNALLTTARSVKVVALTSRKFSIEKSKTTAT